MKAALILLAVALLTGCSSMPLSGHLAAARSQIPAPSAAVSAQTAQVLIDVWVFSGSGRSWSFISDTNSMRPILDSNQVLLLEAYVPGSPILPGQILYGDLVMGNRTQPDVCHQTLVVRPAPATGQPPVEVLTKGFGNSIADGWTRVENIHWRVAAVIYLTPEEIELLEINQGLRKR